MTNKNSASQSPASNLDIDDIIATMAKTLLAKGWRLSTAESCTGGLVSASITALAGSSEWFERGYITYSNQAKSEDTLYLGLIRSLLYNDQAGLLDLNLNQQQKILESAQLPWLPYLQ
jgi:hypothetical protein